jgi:hypothetical protein
MLRHRSGERDRTNSLFECSQRYAAKPVFLVDDLALFR